MFEKARKYLSNLANAALGVSQKAYFGTGGGYYSGGRSGGSKWPFGLSSQNSGLILDHYSLRQNARDAYHDSPQAKGLVDRWADTVVDTGLVVEFTPNAKLLGITEQQAEAWGDEQSQKFDLWMRSKTIHRSETLSGYQIQRQYEIFQQRDNDIFVRFYYSNRKDLLSPVQMEFIDPNQIRGYGFTSTYYPDNSADGIIRDNYGREKAYKVWMQKKGLKPGVVEYEDQTIQRVGARSGRTHMIHGFAPEYAGQGRGYSRLAHMIQEFENITDFTTAQIKKAINQSNISLYTKPSDKEDAPNPFEGLAVDLGAGPAAEQFGSNPNPAGDAENVGVGVNYCPLPEATLDTPGSVGVFNLTEGSDLKAFENTAPAESFDKFVDAFTGYLSASSGMPLEVMLMKFGQSYSASRGALILFWRVLQIWRDEIDYDLMTPLIESWLSEEIAASRVMAPGWMDPRLKAAWMQHKLYSAPMPNIDPQKTANATQKHVEMGLTTLDREARNLNGSSGKTNRAKLVREFSELPESPFKKPSNVQQK